ncbi:MAG: RelA/SpoT domain-containing protein, partial [Cetobacterium sp.]
MIIRKDDFLKKYGIDEEKFENTGLVWEELIKIYLDFETKEKDYKKEAKEILDKLNNFNGVSAVRYRVKDKEHLIEKIIRKRISDKNRVITLENYEKEITDLVGFRVTHIFKDDWGIINKQITKKWSTKEITAFYREGDEEYYSGIGLDLGKMTKKEHPRGYRSVHYILELKDGLYQKNIEIQVRTIFEEAWSEMDHKVIYPYHINNEVLNNYSKILNRVAGMADEMGNFMKKEVTSLSKLDKLDEENKSLKTENEILKAKIREYENRKIDEDKSINKLLKEEYKNLFNPFENSGLSQLMEAQNKYKKMFGVSEESAVAQIMKAQEKYKKLSDPFENSGLSQLMEAQNKYKKMFGVSEESAVAQIMKAQEKYK